MTDISVCQFVNQIDQSNFTLYAEWQDTYFKIILLHSGKVPLTGEMCIKNANYFLRHLEESFDTYLKETKRAFCGENMEIQFFLQDDTFKWKQKILTRGEITVHPLSDILIISDILKQILERYQEYKKRMVVLEKENGYLNEINVKLTTDKEETIKMKEDMEKDLYTKFILLLNSKKQKIRELQEALNKKAIKSKYDETTDESEGSDAEDQNVQETSIKSSNIRKRKANDQDEQKDRSKINKEDFTRYTNFSSSKSPSPEPSTSKDKSVLQNADMQHITKATKQLLNILEEEPEDDLFSQ